MRAGFGVVFHQMACKNSTRFPNGSRNSKREYPGIGIPSIISIFSRASFDLIASRSSTRYATCAFVRSRSTLSSTPTCTCRSPTTSQNPPRPASESGFCVSFETEQFAVEFASGVLCPDWDGYLRMVDQRINGSLPQLISSLSRIFAMIASGTSPSTGRPAQIPASSA